MKPTVLPVCLSRSLVVSACFFGCLPTVPAQTASPAEPPPDKSKEKVLELDPFDVSAGSTQRYYASNSLSGTAMNMPLKDLPMTINVITSEFLEDAVLGNLERALDYNSSVSQTTRGENTPRVGLFATRGFRARNLLLDGVLASDFLPTYLIDRIEVVKGPNTLYGQSDPGGLINIISKRPLVHSYFDTTLKYGSWNTKEIDLDANVAHVAKGINFRVLGQDQKGDGWRWLDGTESKFAALMADWQATEKTKLRFTYGANSKNGVPSNRATYPFMQVATDLNGNGTKTDTVNGVAEATVRYNNDFVPWEWTSQTRKNHLDQHGTYAQASLVQRLSEKIDLQYLYAQTNQISSSNFREFNTFDVTGANPANNTAESTRNTTDANTLNASLRFDTGPVHHSILAGARYTHDLSYNESFRLRSTVKAEKAVLDSLVASGRVIRYTLLKADVLNHVPIWLDDVPTREEIVAAGFRSNNAGNSYEDVTTYYVSDSAAMLNDRLRLLGGVRRIKIVDWKYQVNGTRGQDQRSYDTSYQLGVNYAITDNFVPYANYATSFNPNGFDSTTGEFFSPETSKSWEVGIKFDKFLQGKVSGSVAYYDIKKKNVFLSDFNPFTFVNDTDLADQESKGLDVELFINMTAHWQTTLGYSHNDAVTTKSRTTALGVPLEGAIPNKYTFFTSYEFADGPLKGLRIGGGGFVARGRIQQFGTSNNQYVFQNDFSQLSAFIRYETKFFDRPTTLGISCNNLANEFYIRARANTNDPRNIVGSVKMRF